MEFPIERVHVQLILNPRRHVQDVAGRFTCLSPEEPRRQQPRGAEPTGSFQAGSHREFKRHSYLPCDQVVVVWGADGCVLAADATVAQQLQELHPVEFVAVVAANALHGRRDTSNIEVRQEPREAVGTSDFRFRKYHHPIRE